MEEPKKMKSHSIAIHGFDGQATEIIEANEVRFCVPTKTCITFWATIIACFVAIGVGIGFMVYGGASSPFYSVGLALLGLGCGVLIPGKINQNEAVFFACAPGRIRNLHLFDCH